MSDVAGADASKRDTDGVLELVRNLFKRSRFVLDLFGYGGHWDRRVMNAQIDDYLGTLATEQLIAAEISGAHFARRPWKHYTSLTFPDFDICGENPPVDSFDHIFCEQVLEHVWKPQKALKNLFTMLKPGGTLLVSTPFLIKIHRCPQDYWRFTPDCLERMLSEAGFSVRQIHSWGNKKAALAGLREGGWPKFRPFRTLRNSPDLPIQVWAYAQKPAAALPSFR